MVEQVNSLLLHSVVVSLTEKEYMYEVEQELESDELAQLEFRYVGKIDSWQDGSQWRPFWARRSYSKNDGGDIFGTRGSVSSL